ncbi:IS607 family element RNA-guided endonuclease TnpB [Nocardia tengchongensis]|uniref:IS607 family element RNA-guided endonuclease TnpB n=1 Tax=Nocardia tengchongensis TaxID=2055889 RepID=UPI0034080564
MTIGGAADDDRENRVIQAYRYALEPTAAQEQELRSHCGAQRFAYNWGLARIRTNLETRAAEASSGLIVDQRTPAVEWSAYGLRKAWNQAKDEVAPWWTENSKEAYGSGLANAATALKNWSDSRGGKRAGRRVGFPRFKSRRAAWSCRFTTGSLGLVDADRRHVKLPRIGVVRTGESTRKLARHLDRGSARIRSVTVSLRGGRWFAAFSVEVVRTDRGLTQPFAVVGVDLGVKSLAVLSTGRVVPNPKHLVSVQAKLRRLQRRSARRRGPCSRSRSAPSNRWQKNQVKIARLHAKVANARRDGLHKLTAELVNSYRTVVVEDLNVTGLLANRRLAGRIADAGWGELRRQLDYKSRWRGAALHVADRWFPSSKRCSACGVVKAKLRLHDRTFRCDECGFVLDRDLNAARNLAALVEVEWSAASCAGTVKMPAGNPRKTSSGAMGIATGRSQAHLGLGQRRGCESTTQELALPSS